MAYTETDMEIIKSYAYASDIEERKIALENGGYR